MNDHPGKTSHYWVFIAFLVLLSGFCLRFFDITPASAASLSHDSLASVVTLSGGVDGSRFAARKATGMPSSRLLKTRKVRLLPTSCLWRRQRNLEKLSPGISRPVREAKKRLSSQTPNPKTFGHLLLRINLARASVVISIVKMGHRLLLSFPKVYKS